MPSLPGYGFSETPNEGGWGVERIARAWVELMRTLGYDRFIAAGSDWGTSVSTSIALQSPDALLGIHLVPPLVAPLLPPNTDEERAAIDELAQRSSDGGGYSAVQRSRPQTIGYALVDSPVGLLAWMLEKIWAWSDHDGDLFETIPLDRVLDDVTLYWLTATAASSARLYAESIGSIERWFTDPGAAGTDVPTAATVFPREVPRPSRRWAEARFSRIVHWGEPPRGGHFGAWEQPALMNAELRAGAVAILAARGERRGR